MIKATGWLLRAWCKLTAVLLVMCGAAWLFAPPGWCTASVIVSGLVEVWAVRALAHEWVWEARIGTWWWPR
jgi:hypothetical protein